MKDSFVFYASFYDAIKDIPERSQLNLFKAISELSLYGREIELSGIEATLFKLIKPQILANNQKYENGCKGGRPKKETSGYENKETSGYENKKPNENENENVIEKDNLKVIQKEKFIKPSLEDVIAYCKERNNSVDAEKWYDHYTSNGWKVGKNSMKDWRATVRTWEKSSVSAQASRKTANDDDFYKQLDAMFGE